MAAQAGNLAFQGRAGLKEALVARESAIQESESAWKCGDYSWAEHMPLRSSVASTACTDSDPLHKLSQDLSPTPQGKVHFFPTSRAACRFHSAQPAAYEHFDNLSTEDLEKANADLKALQDLVECLEEEIDNICLREWNKPTRELKCVALPEASTLMRRRSAIS